MPRAARDARTRLLRLVSALSCVALVLSGCTADKNPVVKTVKVQVTGDRPVAVDVPGVGRIDARAGALTGQGTMEVSAVKGDFAGEALTSAGLGLEVAFDGVTQVAPMTVTFTSPQRAGSDLLPVDAHQQADGTWELTPVTTLDDGSWQVQASSFSLHMPGWFNPSKWFKPVLDWMSGAAFGTTDPLACDNAPNWGSVSNTTVVVHTCAQSNPDKDGSDRLEVKIKSNRGYWLQVQVPGNPQYVWVEHQPWPARQWLANRVGMDPNKVVLLAPGATMTIGYPRGTDTQSLSATVGTSGLTIGMGLVDASMNSLIDAGADKLTDYLAITIILGHCLEPGVNYTGSYSGSLSAGFGDFFSCFLQVGAGNLSDPDKARAAVMDVLGSDWQDLAPATQDAKLATLFGKFSAVGWVVSLLPFAEVGWGSAVDQLATLLANSGTQVQISIDPTKVSPSPAPPTQQPPPQDTTPPQPPQDTQTQQPPPPPPPPPSPPPTTPPAAGGQPIRAYDNYGSGAIGHAMCRGNPASSLSMPGGTATQTFTVPAGVATLSSATIQIDPATAVTAHLTVAANGAISTSAATAAGDTQFAFGPLAVQPGQVVTLTLSFTATAGKIITVYTVGAPGGTFTASNSCPDGAQSVTVSPAGLRAVVSGTT